MDQLFSVLGVLSFPCKMLILVSASVYPLRTESSKRRWPFRLLLCAAVIITLSFLILTRTNLSWGYYCAIFVCCIFTAMFPFGISAKNALFCVAGCYAMEHISACFSICWMVAVGVYGGPITLWDRCFSDGIIAVSLVLCYLIFIRHFIRQGNFVPRSAVVGALVIVVLTVALLLSYSQFLLKYTSNSDRDWVACVTAILRMIVCILVLIIQSNLLNNSKLQSDNETFQNMLAQEKKRYQTSRESAELLNIKYHDMKHILAALKASNGRRGNLDSVVEQLESVVDEYDLVKDTGNTSLNTVLFEKRMTCRRQQTQLTYMGNGALLSFLDPIDIYALIGNILDNAIESAWWEEQEKRYIDLKVTENGPFIKVSCENYCSRKVLMKDGLPASTDKDDRANHGFGTKSILYIARKYGGNVLFEQENGLFKATVILPKDTELTLAPLANHD